MAKPATNTIEFSEKSPERKRWFKRYPTMRPHCSADVGGYLCTRKLGHRGTHVANGLWDTIAIRKH